MAFAARGTKRSGSDHTVVTLVDEGTGYLQEDVLLGDLRAFATEELLARSDVISPYLPPYNSSGVLMLFRNAPHVNEVWKRSRAHARVLSTSAYLVFDEWWGALANEDNLARVLGRECFAFGPRAWLDRVNGSTTRAQGLRFGIIIIIAFWKQDHNTVIL